MNAGRCLLPIEVWKTIFIHLDPLTRIHSASLVNKTWYQHCLPLIYQHLTQLSSIYLENPSLYHAVAPYSVDSGYSINYARLIRTFIEHPALGHYVESLHLIDIQLDDVNQTAKLLARLPRLKQLVLCTNKSDWFEYLPMESLQELHVAVYGKTDQTAMSVLSHLQLTRITVTHGLTSFPRSFAHLFQQGSFKSVCVLDGSLQSDPNCKMDDIITKLCNNDGLPTTLESLSLSTFQPLSHGPETLCHVLPLLHQLRHVTWHAPEVDVQEWVSLLAYACPRLETLDVDINRIPGQSYPHTTYRTELADLLPHCQMAVPRSIESPRLIHCHYDDLNYIPFE